MFLNQQIIAVLNHLKNFRYPNFIEERIKRRLERIKNHDTVKSQSYKLYFDRWDSYPQRIEFLEKIREKRSCDGNFKPVNIDTTLPDSNDKIKSIAYESSLYFKQGYEMLKASTTMDINSSPLLDYYAFLQIIKGVILVELEVDKDDFFKSHGIRPKKEQNPDLIHEVRIETRGVFSALLIRCPSPKSDEEFSTRGTFDMEDYYNSHFFPSFTEMVEKDHIQPLYRIPNTFIFSWMLSEIVRYKPDIWQEICLGSDNNWIRNINKFRESIFPQVLMYMLTRIV